MTRDMVARNVFDPVPEHFDNWNVEAWANVNHYGHYNRSHGHTRLVSGDLETLWSGIYYVDPGEQTERSQSGSTVFEDRSGVPKEIVQNPNPFERELSIRPVPGLMVLFPSRLRHRVNLYHGHEPRITIAFNLSHPGFVIPSYQTPEVQRATKPVKRRENAIARSFRIDRHIPVELQAQQMRSLKNTHTRVYAAAAMTLGLDLEIVCRNPSRIAISNGSRRLQISNAVPDCNVSVAKELAWDKFHTYKLLEKNDISVPRHRKFFTQDFVSPQEMHNAILESAWDTFPMVLKPVRSGSSRGVHVLENRVELEQTLPTLSTSGDTELLLEQFVQGVHYRAFFCRNQVIDILYRKNASVTGDGFSTIRELVERQNKERKLLGIPLISERLLVDSPSMPPDTVLEKGEAHRLCNLVNFSLGGTVYRVDLENVHRDNAELLTKVATLSGLEICCVDVIMSDILVSYRDQDYAINEINHAPGQFLPYMADMAKSNQCAEGILAHYFSVPIQS